MEDRDKIIMSILTNAFGNRIPEGAFRAVTDAYKAGIKAVEEWLNKNDWGRTKGSNWQAFKESNGT